MSSGKLKKWVVVDPYIASLGSPLLGSFLTQEEAADWLKGQQEKDGDGYHGCEIMPMKEAAKEFML